MFVTRPYLSETDPSFIELTQDVGYISTPTPSRFGPLDTLPSLQALFAFANIKAYKTSHSAYNILGLSAQVPGSEMYITNYPVEFTLPYWQNTVSITLAKDLSIFTELSELEYMFYDSLVNIDTIFYDAYFKTQMDLVTGIIKKMKASPEVDHKKVWDKALQHNPQLKP